MMDLGGIETVRSGVWGFALESLKKRKHELRGIVYQFVSQYDARSQIQPPVFPHSQISAPAATEPNLKL